MAKVETRMNAAGAIFCMGLTIRSHFDTSVIHALSAIYELGMFGEMLDPPTLRHSMAATRNGHEQFDLSTVFPRPGFPRVFCVAEK
jgi:hypothetical protein